MANKERVPRGLRKQVHEFAMQYEEARDADFESMGDAMYASYYEGYIAGYLAAQKAIAVNQGEKHG